MEGRLGRKLRDLFEEIEAEVMAKLRAAGQVPADVGTRRALENKILDRADEWGRLVSDEAVEAQAYGRRRIINLLQQQGWPIEMTEFSGEVSRRLRERVFRASQRTLERVAGDVMGTLDIAYQDGLGIAEASDLLEREMDNMKRYETERVARTEIQTAQNEGRHETIREHAEFEQWVSADDDRVRGRPGGLYEDALADHDRLHGEITRVDDPFSNGLQHPGDRNGPLHEFINCRCVAVPYILPEGFEAPADLTQFREADLVRVA